ncbi:MAG: hypothetical protein HY294_07770 [Candidatus Rokubacteria bacterium]|nr:hypothetical protein [Candidatus Rokubacteria bacterium]MBI3825877.1 hypothetical protein [Candidatus Rokubacteria bacterium]
MTDRTDARRVIRVACRGAWALPEGKGLLDGDARVRTLRRVLVTYPGVRYILPDRIGLHAGAEDRLLETLSTLLTRQHWLVETVSVE